MSLLNPVENDQQVAESQLILLSGLATEPLPAPDLVTVNNYGVIFTESNACRVVSNLVVEIIPPVVKSNRYKVLSEETA